MSKRKGTMLCYPFEEKRLLKWKPPYLVQPKLDGIRCRAVPRDYMFQAKGYMLLSSECRDMAGVPHIVSTLNKLNMWPMELDGELYRHGYTWEQISSVTSRTAVIHPDHEAIQYHVFDTVSLEPQAVRISQLEIPINQFIFPVKTKIAHNLDEIMKIYDDFLKQGYEGIVVRNVTAPYMRKRSIYMMKFKPKKDDYYLIIDYKEEKSIHGEPKGRLGALICTSDEGTVFSVGSGLTDDDRERLWSQREDIKGKLVHVQYQHITPGKGVPRFPVFMDITENEPEGITIGGH